MTQSGEMNRIVIIALVTQLIFLVGEVPAAGYLSAKGVDGSFYQPWFLIFSITRILGMAGQFYLWSHTQLGFVAAFMGSGNLILSNLLGVFVLHQPPLSLQGYVGVFLAVVSIFLLTGQ